MFNKTLLIEVDDFDNFNTLSKFFKERESLSQLILQNQMQYVRPFLCNDLYAELIAEKEYGEYSDANELLVYGNGVTFFGVCAWLVYLTLQDYYFTSGIESTRAGLKRNNDENSTDISKDERFEMIRDFEQKANHYKAELLNFLRENKETYPLWCDENCGGNSVNQLNIQQISKVQNPFGTYSKRKR
jgi:hypothetical protein